MLCLLLGVFVLTSFAQEQENEFVNPPTNGINNDFSENPTYVQGSTITLLWKTSYPSTALIIWQNGNPDPQVLKSNMEETSLVWEVGTGLNPPFDLTEGEIFFFQIQNSSTNDFFSSHYFNISDPLLESATSEQPPTTTTPPPTASTNPPVTSLPTNASTAETSLASSPSSSDVSQSDKLGMGVGIGIGVCVFLALSAAVAWFYLRRAKSRRRSNEDAAATAAAAKQIPRTEMAIGDPNNKNYGSSSSKYTRHELSASGLEIPSTNSELASGTRNV